MDYAHGLSQIRGNIGEHVPIMKPRSIRLRTSAVNPTIQQSDHRPRRQDTALLDFVQFAIKQKIEFSAVRPDTVEGVRGLFASARISPLDTLISVPRTSALVLEPGERTPAPQLMDEATWTALPW